MFGSKKEQTVGQDTAGAELAKVLPNTEVAWYRTKHLLLLNLMLLVPLFSASAVGYDGSMMNGLQALPQWRNYFDKPRPALLGAINAVYPSSKIIGLPLVAWVSDKWGRKLPLWIGLCSLVLAPAIQAAAYNLPMFIIARSLIGFATVFIALPSPILIAELAYPTHRGKLTALYNTFFFVGGISAAWITYGTFRMHSTMAWRIPSVFQAFFPFLQLLGIYWVPESPRWLIANDRAEEARAILTKHHAAGVAHSPLVDYEMVEITKAIEDERNAAAKAGFATLFRTAANRKRTFIGFTLGFFSQWNGINVVSYYLTLVLNTIGITEAKDQTLINGLLQVFNFIAAVFAGAMMVDRLGRRKLLLIGTGGLLCSYIAWTGLTGYFFTSRDALAGRTVVAFIFIAYFFYDISWTPLAMAYTVEIFPFTLRSRGLTWTLTCSYAGLITAQMLNPIAMAALGWKYYILFCCILVYLVVVIWFMFPETKGRSLEQIGELFEGKTITVEADYILAKGPVETIEDLDLIESDAGSKAVGNPTVSVRAQRV
ncbi:general substrate transporter [Aaosphaeria arxii CBS 175.79]|uniref:General substrate transporter n=1 Tax=Aaosphaeria arxii CBS 175.79 TaxID=1450172 RepID=A0A6A5X7V7_9PLEO|nr:general substrate transporter [Aaosphaeria arxii CBS 175.79]KAF2009022.1 general substrate transporter [Aaosphaeria arxii CBS 175.79]